MPTVTEKAISLDFPPGWAVVKYDGDVTADNANFYREKIEHQMQNVRGVDVVCQAPEPDNRLVLIEVKDFRQSATPAEKSIGLLRQTVLQKALNTLSGLFLAARARAPELTPVTRRLLNATLPIEMVLFLERPIAPVSHDTREKFRKQNPRNAIHNLALDLSSTLHALGLEFHLRSSLTMQTRDGWSARLLPLPLSS